MQLEKNQKQVIVHIDSSLYEQARVIASESHRSFDALLELCLRRLINQIDKEK